MGLKQQISRLIFIWKVTRITHSYRVCWFRKKIGHHTKGTYIDLMIRHVCQLQTAHTSAACLTGVTDLLCERPLTHGKRLYVHVSVFDNLVCAAGQ